jgi:hypothetical protein
MAGLVPAIHRGAVLAAMAGTSPAMTVTGYISQPQRELPADLGVLPLIEQRGQHLAQQSQVLLP